MEFKIGEKVKVKEYSEIDDSHKAAESYGDPRVWTKSKARLCGRTGVIVDKMFSDRFDDTFYQVQFDGKDEVSTSMLDAYSLNAFDDTRYSFSVEIDHGKAIVKMFRQDGIELEPVMITKGIGTIREQTPESIAQAVGFAAKIVYFHCKPGDKMYELGGDYYE